MDSSTFTAAFNIRDHGAVGDGITIDSPAINAAIKAAADSGGGIVVFPAGTYLSFSIHLCSHVTLHLDEGAVLLAATPGKHNGEYDQPEPNHWGDELQYQDFGHSHWHNSLIWGVELTDVAITGPGRIDGRGLLRHATYTTAAGDPGPNGTVAPGIPLSGISLSSGHGDTVEDPLGHGNKAIALKNCQRVTLRDFSVFRGGHFALLATGVDDLTIANVTIDTNRDGLDIDACRNVTIIGCTINSLMDDAIVLKTSYALGELRHCENITIRDCTVSGYDLGTVLDGTFGRSTALAPDRDGPTGRIKIGTESNGDFRNITIADCTFRRSRGLALETVDGGTLEDVTVSSITMEEVTSAPIFLRLGNRARSPEGTPVGRLRRVSISDVTAQNVDGRFPVILAGLPGHPIEDITLRNISVMSHGGIKLADVAAQTDNHVNTFFLGGDESGVIGSRETTAEAVPMREIAYPEPSMFGLLPAAAFYARHVNGLKIENLNTTFETPDERPLVIQDDVTNLSVAGSNLFDSQSTQKS